MQNGYLSNPNRRIVPWVNISLGEEFVHLNFFILRWLKLSMYTFTGRGRDVKNRMAWHLFLPARASERGNVIGSVRIYIYVCTKKNCN